MSHKHTCATPVPRHGLPQRCITNATVQIDGKWYCKQHAAMSNTESFALLRVEKKNPAFWDEHPEAFQEQS